MVLSSVIALLLSSFPAEVVAAGEVGGRGLALRAAKALTASMEGEAFVDHAVLLIKDGRIEALGPAASTGIPEGYQVRDVGEAWISPGMIDLHCHVAGPLGDLNDAIYQANPGLRASATVLPRNVLISRTVQGGVTTVLLIPGSATNMGGQGVLLKTGFERYEDMRLRDPGSLKVAQGDNPTRWGYRMGRGLMNHHIRATARKGIAYARKWEDYEAGRGPRPEKNPQLEVFRALKARTVQVSTHTQAYTLVMNSILMLSGELGFDTFIDHGEWAGYKAVPLAEEHGVAAICGPRELDAPYSRAGDTDGKILGVAAGYQERGMQLVGFNTDSPVVPGETLPLQAAGAVRYGFDDDDMQSVKGVTIVPAIVAGIETRVGSLEPGKDADVIVTAGDPLDPRSGVQLVFIEGRLVYEAPEVRSW
jgi:imidazolonepropionase-like amidohydrolase